MTRRTPLDVLAELNLTGPLSNEQAAKLATDALTAAGFLPDPAAIPAGLDARPAPQYYTLRCSDCGDSVLDDDYGNDILFTVDELCDLPKTGWFDSWYRHTDTRALICGECHDKRTDQASWRPVEHADAHGTEPLPLAVQASL